MLYLIRTLIHSTCSLLQKLFFMHNFHLKDILLKFPILQNLVRRKSLTQI